MYFTSGAKVRTRRSRTLRSPEVLYSCQSARVSSGDRRRAEAVFMWTVAPVRDGRDGTAEHGGSRRPDGRGSTLSDGTRTDVQTAASPEVGTLRPRAAPARYSRARACRLRRAPWRCV